MTTADRHQESWKRHSILWLVALLGISLAGLPVAIFRPPFGAIVYLAAVIGLTVALIRWHGRNTAFVCPGCEQSFTISTRTFVLRPHIGMKKLLACPECGHNGWCRAVPRKTEATNG